MSTVAEKSFEQRYKVQVLDRALAVFEALSKDSAGLTLPELSEKIELHRSTVYRLLMVLERHRYVTRQPASGKYFLGFRFFELASSVIRTSDPARHARPCLEKLVAETGETAHLCIFDQDEVLYLEKVEGARAVRAPSIIGRRYPAHCGGAGKVLLAYLESSALDDFMKRQGLPRYTANTITTPAQLRAELQRVRERGYSIDNEEYEQGLRCVGAPVRDYTGQVVAAISIAGPAFRVTTDSVPIIARAVVDAASQLSELLGHQQADAKLVAKSAKRAG